MKTKMIIKNQKGAAAVEFAIVAPLLVLLVIGICEFGLLWYNSQVIINAADAADTTTPSGVKYIVDTYCANRLITFGVGSVPITDFPNGNDNITKSFGDGEYFSVRVKYTYNFLVPSLFGLGLDKELTGMTLMKMEGISS
jgi:Flp pilus assembly protein TadG